MLVSSLRLKPALILVTSLILLLLSFLLFQGSLRTRRLIQSTDAWFTSTPRTLIILAFSECGDICHRNLEYFTRVGIHQHDYNDYIIVSNGDCKYCRSDEFKQRLEYPNVKFIQRENKGYDFAAYTVGLQSVDVDKYEYFIFFNSGMRGPHLPRDQLKDIKEWPRKFTSLLNDRVKLVGSSLSCEIQIHIQSFFFATDRVGLKLLMNKGVFTTDDVSKAELVRRCELGMTTHMFEAGYTVDSLSAWDSKYNFQELWKNKKGVGACFKGVNPTRFDWYGGNYAMPPLLTVFVKRGGTILPYN